MACSATESEVTAPKIVAGAAHACAYDADRQQVVCWGDNSYGQLGNEEFSAEGVSAPVRVKVVSGRKIKSLSAGYSHTCALVSSGDSDTTNTVACWGYNHYGQVGDGTNNDANVPVFVKGPDGKVLTGVTTLTTGAYHTCASMAKGAKDEGKIYCWGRNDKGQIGNGALTNVNEPTLVTGLEYGGGVAAGTAHTCAFTAKSLTEAQNGKFIVVCWGDASRGQLRDKAAGQAYTTKPVDIGLKLEGVQAIYSEHVVQADVTTATGKPVKGAVAVAMETPAYGQTCAITNDQVLCWGGSNQNGQWGTDSKDATEFAVKAEEIVPGSTLKGYGAGNAQSCMLVGKGDGSDDNQVACWGYSASLGSAMSTETTDAVLAANRKPVELQGQRPTGIAVGREFVCYAAKGDQPQIWCWGMGKKGQIGNASVESTRVPKCVKGYCPDTKKDENLVEGQPFDEAPGPVPSALQVDAGANTSCAVMVGGTVKCWGLYGTQDYNANDYISYVSDSKRRDAPPTAPLPVDVANLDAFALSVHVGDFDACALVLGGALKCWGKRLEAFALSYLGVGSIYTPNSPPTVWKGFESNVKDVSIGFTGACALLESTAIKCLIVPNLNQTSKIFDLESQGSNAKLVGFQPCILKSGAVQCVSFSTSPPTVTPLEGFEAGVTMLDMSAAIDSATRHSCGVFTDGRVKCSGGEVITGLPQLRSIHAGGEHACVLTTSGGVKCWGKGALGQLGNGKFEDSATPVDVQGLQWGVLGLTTGRNHSCALIFGGTVKCWGANGSGQLGNGTTTNSNVPTEVAFGGNEGLRGKVVAESNQLAEGQVQQKVTVTIPAMAGDAGYGFDCGGDGTYEVNGKVAGHECFYDRLGSGSHDIGYKITIHTLFGPTDVTGTTSFTVRNLPPVISAVNHGETVLPAGSNAAKTFTIQSVAASDPGNDPLTYNYDCNLDGKIEGKLEANRGKANVVCDLSGFSPGTYSLGVVVIDADNALQYNGAVTKPITITIAPPLDTTLGTKPGAYSGANVSFTFSSPQTGTVEYKLDAASYAVTTAGMQSYTALTDGTHTFYARAVSGGQADASPATHRWVVDTVAPVTLADTSFAQPVSVASATVAFHATDANALAGFTYTCALDGGTADACTSPKITTPVSEGSHSLVVRATDAAGNATTSPATISWSYWAPPETTLDAGGPTQGSTVSQTTGTFTFSSPTATSYECKLDGGAWTACTSPYTTPTLGNGSHTVQIRALRNGVPDTTAASRTWTVDTGGAQLSPVTGSTLSAGSSHGCAVSGGKIFCWGFNLSNQLGELTGPPQANGYFLPTQMGSATDWASVSAGPSHTCGIRTSGALFCWGANNSGQLGDPGTSTYGGSSTPAPVAAGQTWRKVAAVDQHSCAIRTDKTLWCWGSNGTGALGLGEAGADVTAPAQVGTAVNWVDVGGGYGFTCALNASGVMYCWGEGSMGQLGVGSTDSFGAPLTAAATGVAAMTAGGQYACAVKSNGTLWCWGDNTTSQGGNAVTDRTLPSQVGTATDWKSVEAGIASTCGLKIGGTRWCWGDQTDNALDDGASSGTQATPVQQGASTDWLELSCNQGFCLGVRSTAGKDVFGWGTNGFNQCGVDGTSSPVVSPMTQITPF